MHFHYRFPFLTTVVAAAAVTLAGLCGCEGSTDLPPLGAGGFVSDVPSGSAYTGGKDGGSNTSGGTGGGGPATPEPEDPEKVIAEADIIQLKDGRLYALSQYSGLSIIDVSVKDKLTLLGRYQAAGVPSEMYLRDGVVYAMFSSWWQSMYDGAIGGERWVETSRIEALDVVNPADIKQIGSFDLPGTISDSRIVGDVLYAVSFENGSCYGCGDRRATTITSLSVGDPASIGVIDTLSYNDNDPYSYGWQRSVSVTQDRMYVSGIEWDGLNEGGSTIQVIDISDPTGLLVEGASVEAKGQIQSRWQMDEHEGVLRVISQPGVWWSSAMPAVQTFTVVSSTNLQPLGYTELLLPKPETLRAARFDGARAYAITAEQTDPLFTIDLTDPSQPKQVGELEIPGWIYHIEPRGDRLFTLGFDTTDPDGSLHVSLFNVADMTQPALIQRVAFGGQWSSVSEDQDRIHKAFKVLDSDGLILVPYSGWSWDFLKDSCGSYESGIQLIDFTMNTLVRRGVAPSRGQARRAFLHDARLFAVSDQEVRTFNIDDRSAPLPAARLPLASHVSQTVVVGDLVARLRADWWTSQPGLEVVPLDSPTQMVPLGEVDLAPLLDVLPEEGCSWGFYDAKLFAHGQHVYLAWTSASWEPRTTVATIDVTDPTSPKLRGHLTLDAPIYNYGYYGGALTSGETIVQSGASLILRGIDGNQYPEPGATSLQKARLYVVDMSAPAGPQLSSVVALPDGLGHTPLLLDGTTVLTSHWEPADSDASKVRFYLDRVSVADLQSPVVLAPVNVPGSLLMWDGVSKRALTVDYKRVVISLPSPQSCWAKYGYEATYEPSDPEKWDSPGTCSFTQRTFMLCDVLGSSATLIDSQPIEDGEYISSMIVGDDRAFASAYMTLWVEDQQSFTSAQRLMTVGGVRSGSITLAYESGEDVQSLTPIKAVGTRALAMGWDPTSLWVIDATALNDISVEKKADLASYVEHVTVFDDKAMCSMGTYGLAVVDIGP